MKYTLCFKFCFVHPVYVTTRLCVIDCSGIISDNAIPNPGHTITVMTSSLDRSVLKVLSVDRSIYGGVGRARVTLENLDYSAPSSLLRATENMPDLLPAKALEMFRLSIADIFKKQGINNCEPVL